MMLNLIFCPACKTPIGQVVINPFDNASEELKELQHLAELQATIDGLNEKLNELFVQIESIIDSCLKYFKSENNLVKCKNLLETLDKKTWWCSLFSEMDQGNTYWGDIEKQVRELEGEDQRIDNFLKERDKRRVLLLEYRKIEQKITALKTRRQQKNEEINKSKKALAEFDKENKTLIEQAQTEVAVVANNKLIAESYSQFVKLLQKYASELPARLVEDLEDKVVDLYNSFNRLDPECEKLASVKLPLQQHERLKISFIPEPDKMFDALHVLSEGHIRCVGLAVLAAKNIKENCPILIFDDPVNAIDDDHRGAIRETLFVDDYFKHKQIILAVHGEDFFNRAQQLIGKAAAEAAETYIFSPLSDQRHIQVNSPKRPKNYVLASRALLDDGEYKDCLMSSRRALEYLTDKAWIHYGKHSHKSDPLISVSRRSPFLPWDLRSLCENLCKKTSASKAEIPGKNEIVESFQMLLGINGQSPTWSCLNKGTHHNAEDMPEFELQDVQNVVLAIEKLDAVLVG
ncbi:MAG TPA: ATPase [Phycisphaerales bacterium]|nr:ATPase [Phycisphaerales bacterium]HCD34285.1 ATPase [Phycisphaerales bacterium]|tara:strand:+ start:348 stop:1898 length:1551 start_codon:yes stop_codon:yes gene_type:complete